MTQANGILQPGYKRASLLASAGYELTGFGGTDSMGAVLIAVFSFREGRESFEKASDKQ